MELHKLAQFQKFDEARFTKVDFVKNRRSMGFVLNFLPGQDMMAHHHPGKDLFLYVLEGEGTFTVDGEEVAVSQGNSLYCEAGEKIGFINTSDGKVSVMGTMTKTVE